MVNVTRNALNPNLFDWTLERCRSRRGWRTQSPTTSNNLLNATLHLENHPMLLGFRFRPDWTEASTSSPYWWHSIQDQPPHTSQSSYHQPASTGHNCALGERESFRPRTQSSADFQWLALALTQSTLFTNCCTLSHVALLQKAQLVNKQPSVFSVPVRVGKWGGVKGIWCLENGRLGESIIMNERGWGGVRGRWCNFEVLVGYLVGYIWVPASSV